MKIVSWNVNGIRAAIEKGFKDYLSKESPDILGIQETKAYPEQIPAEDRKFDGYYVYWNPAKRKGYSGTALFSKTEPEKVETGLGIERFDEEGRTIVATYKDFVLLSVYFPNGQKDEERLQYKMDFYDAFLDYIDRIKVSGKNIIICGDVNTAHKEIDLKNPKENENYSGFLPKERAWIDKLIEHGYTDTYRKFHPDERDCYSWWSYRFNCREKNIGWRIDYFFVSEGLLPRVKDAVIRQDVFGSDHCPVVIELK